MTAARPVYQIPQSVLLRTFEQFRACGAGRRECQTLWLSAWQAPELIREVVHPRHQAHRGGFELDSGWLTAFWLDLARRGVGVRVQIHTHPQEAFHSATDDEFPLIHSVGFLSLVIPRFGLGPIGFDEAFLAEIAPDGTWRPVPIDSRLSVIE